MKKIKKLTLNKEVVSILGGNDMNLVKGGYSEDGSCNAMCHEGGAVGGGGIDVSFGCGGALSGGAGAAVCAGGTGTCAGVGTCQDCSASCANCTYTCGGLTCVANCTFNCH